MGNCKLEFDTGGLEIRKNLDNPNSSRLAK